MLYFILAIAAAGLIYYMIATKDYNEKDIEDQDETSTRK